MIFQKPLTLSGGISREPKALPGGFHIWRVAGGTAFCDNPNCSKPGSGSNHKNDCERKALEHLGPRPWPWERGGGLSCWDLVAAVLPHTNRALFYGPPSTGKTFAAMYGGLAAGDEAAVVDFGQPSRYTVTLTEETPAAELRGVWSPRGTEGLVFMYGPAALAMLGGKRLVLNEIDRASPDCHSILYGLTESDGTIELTLPNGETIHPKPGYHVFATMNGNPFTDLPEALHTRFPVKFFIDRVNPTALAELPEAWRGPAETLCLIPEESRRTYLREWLAFRDLLAKDVKAELAAMAVFGARAGDILTAVRLKTAK